MNAKQDLIKRYIYLYENASFILAPFVKKVTNEEKMEIKQKTENLLEDIPNSKTKEEFLKKILRKEIFFQMDICDSIVYLLEEFLFTSEDISSTKLYKLVEANKKDSECLKMIKEKLELAQKNSIILSLGEILERVGLFLDHQSGDLKNKTRKLDILDEYYRLYRYKNNGRIFFSGRKLNLTECGISLREKETIPRRNKRDVGIKKNEFICALYSLPKNDYNDSIFTEQEKQEVYLKLHDELPWNLEISCNGSEELDIQKETKCCKQSFNIIESKIFIGSNLKFYQMCPNCGYFVEIPSEILTPGIIKKIKQNSDINDVFDLLCAISKYKNNLYHINKKEKQKVLRFVNEKDNN